MLGRAACRSGHAPVVGLSQHRAPHLADSTAPSSTPSPCAPRCRSYTTRHGPDPEAMRPRPKTTCVRKSSTRAPQ
eukprot:CAMPEP_0183369516 /NCGR_PEP_ID=MMETSP0164_2-20130417/99559_1 /TAXON_ID=221442 /ORGANISM="Coccolithus pelagicus ssp braarudi, Strain PLY182g" /LENGTH=74 /DNA_ID=CAMNT_0025545785 /DNA_START=218 /DNA_END=439 /DNA_ORIENTATION=-